MHKTISKADLGNPSPEMNGPFTFSDGELLLTRSMCLDLFDRAASSALLFAIFVDYCYERGRSG
jgi:hypothetical protein